MAGAALILGLASCASDQGKTFDTGPATDNRTGASTEPSQSDAPNVGDDALKLAQTRDGADYDTTLHEVKFPYAPGEYRDPDDPKKNAWVGLRIEQCLDKNAKPGGDTVFETTYNSEWAIISSDGYDYAGSGSSWTDWPSPKFPESVGMIPGRCSKGWIALEITKDTKIAAVQFRPGDTPVAEWVP